MISHHSVIFQPLRKRLWVSTSPYQLGAYLAYHPEEVFSKPEYPFPVYDTSLTIPADSFLFSGDYSDYRQFIGKRKQLVKAIDENKKLPDGFVKDFVKLNPEYYQSYVLAGDYYVSIDSMDRALAFYRFSLSKEFEKLTQRKEVEEKISKINSR